MDEHHVPSHKFFRVFPQTENLDCVCVWHPWNLVHLWSLYMHVCWNIVHSCQLNPIDKTSADVSNSILLFASAQWQWLWHSTWMRYLHKVAIHGVAAIETEKGRGKVCAYVLSSVIVGCVQAVVRAHTFMHVCVRVYIYVCICVLTMTVGSVMSRSPSRPSPQGRKPPSSGQATAPSWQSSPYHVDRLQTHSEPHFNEVLL